MKKLILCTLIVLILNVQKTQAQKNTGIAAAAGALVGAVAIKIAIEQYKEQMELYATQHILESQPDINKFELSLIDFEGVKFSDLSNVSCINFGLKLIHGENSKENKVLMMFLSRGWLNEFGIDVTRVKWKLLTTEEWDNIFYTYIELASAVKLTDKNMLPIFKVIAKKNVIANIESYTLENPEGYPEIYQKTQESFKIESGKLTGNNFQYLNTEKSAGGNFKMAFPLAKYDENTYLLKDFSPEFKVIYNEKTMGLYIKSLGRLVQLQRSTINLIHAFLH